MVKKKRRSTRRKGSSGNKWKALAVVAVVLAAIVYYLFFSSMAGGAGNTCIRIDTDDNIDSVLVAVKRVSKPGLRIYVGSKEVPKVMKGLGIAIVSTSRGIMTDKAARRENVGGEVLAFVW